MLCCPKTSTSSSPPDSASSSHRVTRLQTSNFSHLHHHTATNHHAPPVRRPAPRLDFANAISSRARTLLRAPLLSRGVHHSLPVPAIPEHPLAFLYPLGPLTYPIILSRSPATKTSTAPFTVAVAGPPRCFPAFADSTGEFTGPYSCPCSLYFRCLAPSVPPPLFTSTADRRSPLPRRHSPGQVL